MKKKTKTPSKTPSGNGSDSEKKITEQPPSASQAITLEPPLFSIQRIYLKNVVYDSPRTPVVFSEEWKPQLDTKIQSSHSSLSDGTYEVILTINLTSKTIDHLIFSIEIKQGGIFKIEPTTDKQLNAILAGACPNVMFPYVRETISDLVSRGTFPLLYLAPIDFEAVYEQSIKQQIQ